MVSTVATKAKSSFTSTRQSAKTKSPKQQHKCLCIKLPLLRMYLDLAHNNTLIGDTPVSGNKP